MPLSRKPGHVSPSDRAQDRAEGRTPGQAQGRTPSPAKGRTPDRKPGRSSRRQQRIPLTRKLAKEGCRQNRELYTFYRITLVAFIFVFNSILSIRQDERLGALRGMDAVNDVLKTGSAVMIIFSFLFFFNVDKDLVKKRSKEIGLYSVLGLNKRQIGRVFVQEFFRVWGSALLIGLVLSTLLFNIMEELFVRSLQGEVEAAMLPSLRAWLASLAVYFVLGMVLALARYLRIARMNPLEILQQEKVKASFPLSARIAGLIGLVLIVAGYVLSLRADSPMAVNEVLFPAILLVILGSFIGFQGLAIFILRLLKKDKKRYYKPANFTAWSGLEKRLSSNANGLAAITVLSCATLTLFFLAFSLNFGLEDMIDKMFARDYSVHLWAAKSEDGGYPYLDKLDTFVADPPISIEDPREFLILRHNGEVEGQTVRLVPPGPKTRNSRIVLILQRQAFPELKDMALEPGQALYYTGRDDDLQQIYSNPQPDPNANPGALDMDPVDIQQLKKLDQFKEESMINRGAWAPMVYVFVDDLETYMAQANTGSEVEVYYDFNSKDQPDEVTGAFGERQNLEVTRKNDFSDEVHGIYGGIYFVGIFLGLAFLMGTGLVIYNKQMAEAYDDLDRIAIYRQVGMTEEEVKASVNRQIRTLFLLPPTTTLVHMLFFYPMLNVLLTGLGILGTAFKLRMFFILFAVYFLVYLLYYQKTSRSYYRVVSPAK